MSEVAALGSDEGVRAVYRAHGPELFRFALRSLGDQGLAEEAVQETFVRAWQAAGRFDDALGSLRTWLFAIIRNIVIDMSRAEPSKATPTSWLRVIQRISGRDTAILDLPRRSAKHQSRDRRPVTL